MSDFIVIGGGVYGCGVAWELAKRGAEVLLLEASTVASGASGGLGKRGVRANGRDLRELPLMRLAYEQWPNLHQEIDAPTGYERIGGLCLIERNQEYMMAEARAWSQNQQGIPTRLIDRDELGAMEPDISDRVVAALYCPRDGVADHSATTRGLAQAGRRLGVEIREQTTVVNIECKGNRVMAVLTEQGERISLSHTLLLLSNTHVPPSVRKHLGVTLPVWQILPQVLLTEPLDPMPVRHLIGHAHRKLSIKSVPGGSVMISGGWLGRWNADAGRAETTPNQVDGNKAEAMAVYPCLAEVSLAEAAADRPETCTVDDIPVIDVLPGANNMIVATGWSGHGWAIAPAVNHLLAQWAYTGTQPDLLRPFRYNRFKR